MNNPVAVPATGEPESLPSRMVELCNLLSDLLDYKLDNVNLVRAKALTEACLLLGEINYEVIEKILCELKSMTRRYARLNVAFDESRRLLGMMNLAERYAEDIMADLRIPFVAIIPATVIDNTDEALYGEFTRLEYAWHELYMLEEHSPESCKLYQMTTDVKCELIRRGVFGGF